MTAFVLDRQLAADTLPLCQSDLNLLLVAKDARFPWLILVPKRPGLADLVDLDLDDEPTFTAELRGVSLALRETTGCDKLNVASLGNMVRQLHVHVIARFETDATWPGPIWGQGQAEPLTQLPDWAITLRQHLGWPE